MGKWRVGAVRVALAAAAVFSVSGAFGNVFYYDPDIKILKAVGSPAITVNWSGIKASKIELRINGISFGYRLVNGTKSSGEIGFTINAKNLQPGDNLIEAVLLDAAGNSLGTQKTVMSVQKAEQQPVYIKVPRMGDSVQGTVDIQVGFGIKTGEQYVSFFVDKQFRAMKNFPPYNYVWDTVKESNGWHEIEVWTYDEAQNTKKSPTLRVFVQNPGGRTERNPTSGDPALSNPPVGTKTGEAAGVKSAAGNVETTGTTSATAPKTTASLTGNDVKAPTGKSLGERATVTSDAQRTGHRLSTPSDVQAVVISGTDPPARIKLKYGSRVARDGNYSIYFNESAVKFDVSPVVRNGVALTPFRHLYEHAGGKVDWQHLEKVCSANGLGYEVWLKVGDLFAKVNGKHVQLELAPYIETGRTIVPLSFLRDTLNVEIEYDARTGHVLITQASKK